MPPIDRLYTCLHACVLFLVVLNVCAGGMLSKNAACAERTFLLLLYYHTIKGGSASQRRMKDGDFGKGNAPEETISHPSAHRTLHSASKWLTVMYSSCLNHSHVGRSIFGSRKPCCVSALSTWHGTSCNMKCGRGEGGPGMGNLLKHYAQGMWMNSALWISHTVHFNNSGSGANPILLFIDRDICHMAIESLTGSWNSFLVCAILGWIWGNLFLKNNKTMKCIIAKKKWR